MSNILNWLMEAPRMHIGIKKTIDKARIPNLIKAKGIKESKRKTSIDRQDKIVEG